MFAIIKEQEVNIRLEKIIFHIDVNSAFLSWEAVYRLAHCGEQLDLREAVSAVGGDTSLRHGIILAKSIPANSLLSHVPQKKVRIPEAATFSAVSPRDTVYAKKVLLALSETLGERLRADKVSVSVVAVGIRYADLSYIYIRRTYGQLAVLESPPAKQHPSHIVPGYNPLFYLCPFAGAKNVCGNPLHRI